MMNGKSLGKRANTLHRYSEQNAHSFLLCLFLVLFLMTEGMSLFSTASTIRNEILNDIELEADTLLSQVTALSTDDSADIAEWQKTMVTNEGHTSATYPWRSASAIVNTSSGLEVVQSANILLVSCTSAEKEKLVITVHFLQDNTPELQQLLQQVDFGQVKDADYTLEMTGYWARNAFYAERLVLKSTLNDREELCYSANSYAMDEGFTGPVTLLFGNSGSATYPHFHTTSIYKSYYSTTGQRNHTKSWKKTDRLLQDLMIGFYDRDRSERNIQGGLFKTRVTLREDFTDRSGILDAALQYYIDNLNWEDTIGQRYSVLYGAECSPLRLAISLQLRNGQLPITFLAFLLAYLLTAELLLRIMKGKLTVLQDEVERQKAALEFAEHAEESRREMTAAIAHELKTPISILSGYAEALQEGVPPEKQEHYLSIIQEETTAMNRLILELLDLSRLEAGKYTLERESFDLKKLAEELLVPLQPMIAEKQLSVLWKTDTVMYSADKYRIGQVFQNFMTNAIRHTPNGGRIIIRIGVNHVMLSVENEGSHIPQEALKKVFESFWRGDKSRNSSGTGLGLTLCNTIMKLHGGSCRVENTSIGVQFFAELTAGSYEPIRSLPKEKFIALTYPIAQEETTVASVMQHLSLLSGKKLRKEVQCGRILVDGVKVSVPKHRLHSGNILCWNTYRITVRKDDTMKRQALLQNSFTPGGGLYSRGNISSPSSGAVGK